MGRNGLELNNYGVQRGAEGMWPPFFGIIGGVNWGWITKNTMRSVRIVRLTWQMAHR